MPKNNSRCGARGRKALIHGIANCLNCDWTCGDYNTVKRKAAEHARQTGHSVSAELGYAITYSSNEKGQR